MLMPVASKRHKYFSMYHWHINIRSANALSFWVKKYPKRISMILSYFQSPDIHMLRLWTNKFVTNPKSLPHKPHSVYQQLICAESDKYGTFTSIILTATFGSRVFINDRSKRSLKSVMMRCLPNLVKKNSRNKKFRQKLLRLLQRVIENPQHLSSFGLQRQSLMQPG